MTECELQRTPWWGRGLSPLQLGGFILCGSLLRGAGAENTQLSRAQRRSCPSPDSLPGDMAGEVLGALVVAPGWPPVVRCPGRVTACSAPKTQGRLTSSLCVYGYTQGQEGATVKLSSNKVTKPVSVGAGTGTKPPARRSLIPALILPAVNEGKTHDSNRHFFAVKITLVFLGEKIT